MFDETKCECMCVRACVRPCVCVCVCFGVQCNISNLKRNRAASTHVHDEQIAPLIPLVFGAVNSKRFKVRGSFFYV